MADASDAVAELARGIRPYLGELVDAAKAEEVDAALALLLRDPDAAGFETGVLALLDRDAKLADWAAAFLETGMPPDFAVTAERGSGSYAPLGGRGVVPASRYVCPEGDYVRWQRTVGVALAPCPTHGADLVPG